MTPFSTNNLIIIESEPYKCTNIVLTSAELETPKHKRKLLIYIWKWEYIIPTKSAIYLQFRTCIFFSLLEQNLLLFTDTKFLLDNSRERIVLGMKFPIYKDKLYSFTGI